MSDIAPGPDQGPAEQEPPAAAASDEDRRRRRVVFIVVLLVLLLAMLLSTPMGGELADEALEQETVEQQPESSSPDSQDPGRPGPDGGEADGEPGGGAGPATGVPGPDAGGGAGDGDAGGATATGPTGGLGVPGLLPGTPVTSPGAPGGGVPGGGAPPGPPVGSPPADPGTAVPRQPGGPPGLFRISGDLRGLLPGVETAFEVEIDNPQSFAIRVQEVTVAVGDPSGGLGGDGPPCRAAHLAVGPYSGAFHVPRRGSAALVLLARLAPDAPSACQGASFPLTYGGSAVRADGGGA